MKASEVLTRAASILQDEGVYWPDSELLHWLNDGRNRLYDLRPDLYATAEDVPLDVGAVQQLPGGSRVLFSVVRNVSARSQRVITVADTDILGRHRPNWRSGTAATEIRHYLYDERDGGGRYEVYPPARAGVVVAIKYAALPGAALATDDLVPEGASAHVLVDYVLHKAFLKEGDASPQAIQRAALHLQLFEANASGSATPKLAVSPNRGTPGPQPT